MGVPDVIWTVTDPQGRPVTLLDSTWRDHIATGHPEIRDHESLSRAVTDPDAIREEVLDTTVSRKYVRKATVPEFSSTHLVVAATFERVGPGSVATAYLMRRQPNQGIEIWKRPAPK